MFLRFFFSSIPNAALSLTYVFLYLCIYDLFMDALTLT